MITYAELLQRLPGADPQSRGDTIRFTQCPRCLRGPCFAHIDEERRVQVRCSRCAAPSPVLVAALGLTDVTVAEETGAGDQVDAMPAEELPPPPRPELSEAFGAGGETVATNGRRPRQKSRRHQQPDAAES